MRNGDILISGAGIAGPALAFWLNRWGWRTTIVERAPQLRAGGYKVDVRGAAVEVLAAMGLLEHARAAATQITRAALVDAAGHPIAALDADLFGGRAERDVEINRGDLARLLYAATCGTTEYIFGDTIADIEQDEQRAAVTFAGGARRTFELVVGADGLHSTVRRLVFGGATASVHPLGHTIAIFSVPAEYGRAGWELFHALPGRTVILYRGTRDTTAKAMLIFADPSAADGPRDAAAQHARLAAVYARAGWVTPQLLAQLDAAPDFYCDSISQVRLAEWSRGRTVLLGDAAYCPSPASGQGTSLALVGAYVLAGELATAAGDYPGAFARYAAEMGEYVRLNQQLAITNLPGMVPSGRAQIWLQTQLLRLLPYLPGKERIAGRVAHAIQHAATAIKLKEYPAAHASARQGFSEAVNRCHSEESATRNPSGGCWSSSDVAEQRDSSLRSE